MKKNSALDRARARLERKGFAVIEAGNTDRETLREVAGYFGRIQNHPKAGPDGIVDLITHRTEASGEFDRSKASVHAEFQPHSDGAFVDGFWVENGFTERLGPPSLFLLQCVNAAENGGESLLIDCQAVFEDLRRESPEIFSRLQQPNLCFCGGKDYSLSKSLFERISPERWRVRFRSDLVMVEESAQPAVRSFFHDYVLNPKYHEVFRLRPGEILIADNFRLLHGRKEIHATSAANRHVRRVWIWDDQSKAQYLTLEGSRLPRGAFLGMEGYGRLPIKSFENSDYPLNLGIREGE